jgi:hypothetical protein
VEEQSRPFRFSSVAHRMPAAGTLSKSRHTSVCEVFRACREHKGGRVAAVASVLAALWESFWESFLGELCFWGDFWAGQVV